MINHIVEAFWLFLPAGVANMTPPLANKLPIIRNWNTPMDFGMKWGGKALFGKNKTWRGFVTGVVAGGIVAGLQYSLVSDHYSGFTTVVISILLGAIMGAGALLGDTVESFFKRRANVKPGQSWFPFDQIDYIIGGIVTLYPFVQPPFIVILWIFVLYFGLHLIVSYFGYRLGFKDTPI